MITTILLGTVVMFCVHQITKQVKHDRMMKDFDEWMKNDFNDTFDRFVNEQREYYETGDGKVFIENLKKGDVKF